MAHTPYTEDLDKSYVSETDHFLQDFDKKYPKKSKAQLQEIEKARRIAELRDNPDAPHPAQDLL